MGGSLVQSVRPIDSPLEFAAVLSIVCSTVFENCRQNAGATWSLSVSCLVGIGFGFLHGRCARRAPQKSVVLALGEPVYFSYSSLLL